MDIGKLNVSIYVESNRVTDVVTSLSRPVEKLTAQLIKQNPKEACSVLPMLFSICGNAHSVAGVYASNLDDDEFSPTQKQVFSARIGLENFREYVLRLHQIWLFPIKQTHLQSFLKNITELLLLLEKSEKKLLSESENSTGNLHNFSEKIILSAKNLEQLWLTKILMHPDLHEVNDDGQTEVNSETSLTNTCNFLVWQTNLKQTLEQTFGAVSFKLDECLKTRFSSLDYLMSTLPEDDTLSKSTVESGIVVTGGAAVLINTLEPLGAQVLVNIAVGLLEKSTAIASDLFERLINNEASKSTENYASRELDNLVISRVSHQHNDESDKTFVTAVRQAWVYTSRGWLLHQIEFEENNNPLNWKICAPTDFNFPNGSVGLLNTLLKKVSLNTTQNEQDIDDERRYQKIKEVASWLIKAIDPCLDYEVQVMYA